MMRIPLSPVLEHRAQTADAGVCNAAVTVTGPTTGDNCGVASVINDYTGTANASGTYPVGTTTVTWTVTDIHGNTNTCTQNITVTDDEDPTITCSGAQTQTADAGVCNAAVTVTGPATGDNCGVASVINDYTGTANASGTYPVGTTTVTWTVTDIHGNTNTCTQNITVTDDEDPTITCSGAQTQTADAGVCNAAVTVTGPATGDNCGVASVINDYTGTANASGTYPVGTTTVTWTVTDIHGNTNTCTQNITVTDDEDPTITCSGAQTQTADAGVCNAAVTVTGPATGDNCGVASVINDYTGTANASGTYPVGTTTVTWTVTDIHGNTNTCTQNITVTDDEDPTITCSGAQTQTADAGVCNAAVTVTGPATGDNCGVASVINDYTGTANASGTYPVGTTTVTWTVTDIHGNTNTCTQNITVTDDEDPTITCSGAQTQTADAGVCNAAVTVTGPATGDNCGVASVINDYTGTANASGTYPVGTTTVTWTVTDIHGNTNTCTQNITVTDDEDPTITCSGAQSQPADPGVCNAAVTVTGPATGDNCGVASVINDYTGTANASGTYPVGTTTVTWTVTDIHGNTNTCTQNITVTDNEFPTAICKDITIYLDEITGSATITADDVDNGSFDFCGIVNRSIDIDHFTCSDIGDNPVTLTVEDASGNISTCISTVTVEYTTIPNPTAIPDDVVLCNGEFTGIVLDNTFDNIQFVWTVSAHTDIQGASDGSYDASGSGLPFTIAQQLTNTGTEARTVTYTITPTIYGECTYPDIVINIEVNPRPRIVVTTDAVQCYDGEARFAITRPHTLNTGTWLYDVQITYPADVTGTYGGPSQVVTLTDLTATGASALLDDLTNSGSDVQSVEYIFTPKIDPNDGGSVCGSGVSQTLTIEINPRPRIVVTTDAVQCYDGEARFAISRPHTLNTGTWLYDVQITYPADVTGTYGGPSQVVTLTDLTATGASALLDDLTNSGSDVQSVEYIFTPKIDPNDGGSVCGSGVSQTLTIEINPRPRIVVTTDAVQCYDGEARFAISRPHTLNTGTWLYDVQITYPADVTGTYGGPSQVVTLTDLTATGASALLDDLTNSGSDVQSVEYIFTPKIDPNDGGSVCGSGVSQTLTIEIDPRPRIAVTTDPVLCYDGDALFDISTVNTSVSSGGEWRYDVEIVYPADVDGTFGTAGNTVTLTDLTATGVAALTDDLINNGNIVRTVTYTFTPHIRPGDGGTECANGVPVVLTIEIDPRPRIAVTTDPVLCYDGDALFDISTVNTSVSSGGEWRYDVEIVYPADVTGTYGGPGATVTVSDLTPTGVAAFIDDLINNGNIVRTVTYTFTPHIRPGDGGTECANGVPVVLTIEIDPRPRIAVTTDPVLCYDGDALFDISTVNTSVSSGGEWRYDLEIVYPADVDGTFGTAGNTVTLTDLTATGVAALTDDLINNGNIVRTVTYTFTPHIRPGDGGTECANGVPVVLTIEIDPRPRIAVTTDPVLCYDGDALFDISTVNTSVSSGGEWRYDVEIVYPADVTGTYGGPGATVTVSDLTPTGVAAFIDDLTNNGNIVRTVTYTFTPHIRPGDGGTECANGVPVVLTIEIDPRPRIAVTTDPVLCYDGDALFDISTVNTSVSSGGEWRYDLEIVYPADVDGTFGTAGNTVTLTDLTATGVAALTDDLINNGNIVRTVTYTFTPHIRPGDGGTECANGVPVVLTIEIDPRPRIAVTTDPVLCYDGDALFDISTVNTSVSSGGEWRYDVEIVYPDDVTGTYGGPGATVTVSDLTPTGVAAFIDDLINNGNIVRTVTYTFTPHIRPGDGGTECANGVPVVLTIEIDPRPRIAVTTDPVLCYDGDALFDISTVNTSVSSGGEWRYDVEIVYPADVDGTFGTAGNTVTLTDLTATGVAALTDDLINNGNIVRTVTYTFTPHIRPGDGGTECANGVPVVLTIEIDPRPRIAVTTDPVLCYDGDALFDISTVNTSVSSGGEWRYDVEIVYPADVDGTFGTAGNTVTLTDLTATGVAALTDDLINNGNIVRTVTYTFTPHIRPGDGGTECANGVPVVLTIEIDPRPRIAVTTDPVLCYDGDALFDISTVNTSVSSGGEWRYDVEIVYPANVTGTYGGPGATVTVSDLTPTGVAAFIDDLTNNGNIVRTVTYKFTPHIRPGDGGTECQNGVPVTLTIQIDPRPRIAVTTDPVLCYDGNALFDISTVNTSVSTGGQWRYDVRIVYPANVTGTYGGPGATVTLSNLTPRGIAAFIDDLTNNGNIVRTVTYTFTPHILPGDGGSECQNGIPVTLNIEIDPRPRIAVTTNAVLCYDGDALFNVSTVNTSVSIGGQWRYDVQIVYPADVDGTFGTAGNTVTLTNLTATGVAALTDDLINNGDVVRMITYTFIPHIRPGDGGSECQNGVPVIVNILIEPTPRVQGTINDDIICNNDLITITLASPTVPLYGIRFNVNIINAYPEITGYSNRVDLTVSSIINENINNSGDTARMIMYVITPATTNSSGIQNCPGINDTIRLWINPTPRVIPINIQPEICFGTATEVVLTSPTVMTSGEIRFDYTISFSGVPGDVTGNSAPGFDLHPFDTLKFNYRNSAPPERIDVVSSTLYGITPKVDNAICVPGITVVSDVKVHPRTIKYNYPGTNGTGILITKPLTCNISSGLAALKVILTEGADPYQVYWTGPVGYTNDSVEINNIYNGKYTVSVTDNLGCYNDSSINIVPFTARPQIFPIPILPNIHVTCPGGSDGAIRVYVSSGITAPYSYLIIKYNLNDENDRDTLYTGVFTNNYDPADTDTYKLYENLEAGNYMIIIHDVNGCEVIKTAELKEPEPITAHFVLSDYSGDNVSCRGYSDGSVLADMTGGNGTYSYFWYPATGSLSVSNTTNLLDSITAGKYYLITTDWTGCSKLDSVTLTEPDGMELIDSNMSVSPDGITNVSCYGGSDGHINMTISGGSGVYFFNWSNGATSEDISDLPAGDYSCIVTDLYGCELTPSPSFTLTEPDELIVTSISSDSDFGSFSINCNGGTGSIEITVSGGVAGTYQYNWTTADGSGIIDEHNKDQLALTAGTYRLEVTDLNFCSKILEITLTEPPELETQIAATNITCESPGFNNGLIELAVSGGVEPYSYLWSTGATTRDLSGLSEGNYKVTVTDANGCIIEDSARIELPPPLDFSRSLSDYNGYNISCHGLANGSINIESVSGAAPIVYSWTGPDGYTSDADGISGLKAGTYTLLITDSNYCTATEIITLTEPGPIGMSFILSSSTAGGFNLNCAGDSLGTIEIAPVNVVNSAQFLWSDGNSDNIRTNLPSGTYSVIITDENNCTASSSTTLTEPDSLRLSFAATQPFCPDKPDGEILLNVTGGVRGTDYYYRWSDNSTNRNLSDIPKGFYKVTVSDMNGCSISDSIAIEPLNETCLIIPNAISPNDDLVNDYWRIGLIELYPQMEIKIFNRWGEILWRSEKGYPQPWDGRSNGKDLPIDSYHYIIDLHNGSKPLIGNVTIVR